MSITVKSLHIYPLKSGAGIDLLHFDLTERGPQFDRLWMLVKEPKPGDEHLTFITQRDRGCEKLALIVSRPYTEGSILFMAPEHACYIDIDMLDAEVQKVKIHRGFGTVQDAGDEAAKFFSDYLEQPARLVRIADGHPRAANPAYYREGDVVSLADGAPVLITSTSSLESLKSYFNDSVNVDMARFRPNIVLEGLKPFEEDAIREIKIGNTILEIHKPCDRCPMPNIDQATGIKHGNEVTSALVKTRFGKGDGLQGVFFGQNAVPRTLGQINVGDEVEIISRQEPHAAVAQTVLRYER